MKLKELDSQTKLKEWLKVAKLSGISNEKKFKEDLTRAVKNYPSLAYGIPLYFEKEGKVIATIFIQETHYDSPISITIDYTAVLEKLRNKGIGQELLKKTFAKAKSLGKKFVLVTTGETKAGEFYEKCGMKKFFQLPDNFKKRSKRGYYCIRL